MFHQERKESGQRIPTLAYNYTVSLDVDAGPTSLGQISLTGKVGSVQFIEPPIDLKSDAPDMQFGCGNTLCAGIQEERSGSFEFDPQFQVRRREWLMDGVGGWVGVCT